MLPFTSSDSTQLRQALTADDVQAALDAAEACQEKVANYIDVATDVRTRFMAAHDNAPATDYPYGEDLLRVRPLEDPLESATEGLRTLLEAVTNALHNVTLAAQEQAAIFAQASQTVHEAASTLADCTDLPLEDDDPEEYNDLDDDFGDDMGFEGDNDDDGR